MNETEMNSQGQKPKISRLATWSLVLGVIGFVSVFVLTLLTHGPGAILGLLIGLAGIILGIAALVKIQQSGGLLKGRIFAIFGILSCIVGQILGIYFAGAIFFYAHEILWRDKCGENLKELGIVMRNYASKHDGRYPIADEWCDTLLEYDDGQYVIEKLFVCRSAGEGRCHYAINPNCKPKSPEDMVLLFETKGGWNQVGGPEILTTENHRGKGCNILFNNGNVEFVRSERLGELRWEVGESEK